MKSTQAKPWLRYYSPADLALVMPQQSVFDYLLERNKNRMDTPSMNYFDRIFTFGEVVENVYKAADAYAAMGVGKDDIVLVCAPCTPETVYTFYGLSLLGAVSNMVDPRHSVEGIHGFIEEVGCKYVMTIDVAYDKIVEAVRGTAVEKVIVLSPGESLPKVKKLLYGLKNPPKKNMPEGFMSWGEFIEGGRGHKAEYLHGHHDSCCIIVHTGGTTGPSKSVMLSHDNLNAVSFEYDKCPMKTIRTAGKDKFLNVMPPFVAYGMGYGVHLPLGNGITTVIIPQFKPEDFAKYVNHYQPQDIAGAPSHFLTLIKDKRMEGKSVACFKNACVGGDNISLANEQLVNKFLREHGAKYPLTKGYGMTELSAVATACMMDMNRLGSVGIPHADYLIAAFDPETGEELEMGEIGEICVHGPTMMMGYYNNPAETANIKRTHKDGLEWIHTGDLGYMDEDGFLFIKGRIKRMIIRTDGFKIFPSAIEDVVCEDENVDSCVTVGTDDLGAVQGQFPVVFAKRKVGCTLGEEELRAEIKALCEKKLPEYQQPRYYFFIDAIDYTPVGKVDFRKYEALAAELVNR